MSFATNVGRAVPSSSSNSIIEEIRQNIMYIGQNNTSIKKSISLLGTKKDSLAVRHNMYDQVYVFFSVSCLLRCVFLVSLQSCSLIPRNAVIHATRELCKETTALIKRLGSFNDDS